MPTTVKVGTEERSVLAIRVKAPDQNLHLVKAAYQYQLVPIDGSLTDFELKWVKLEDYAVPWITVPGASLSQGSEVLGPTTYTCGWTIATDSGDAAYPWNVRVQWYKLGVLQDTDLVPQSAGGAHQTFNAQDQISCVLGYVNSNGSGDTVSTDTV